MSEYSEFVQSVKDAAITYATKISELVANPQCLSEHDLALALLDVSDLQGWDRLTWTGDADEYRASYGEDDEGNEFDPVPPSSAIEFARDLLKGYDVVKKAK